MVIRPEVLSVKTVGRNHGHLKYSWASNHLTSYFAIYPKWKKSLDYEQSLFFLGPSSKTPETRK